MRPIARVASALVALVACAGIAGCSGSSTDRAVTVVGSGEVRGAPDILNAELGTEVVAPDVSGAVAQSNERTRAVIDAVAAAGVAKQDVQTADVSIQPDYAQPGQAGGPQTVSGYRATNSLRIVVRDLSTASTVLDDAIRAGGDSARLNNVQFAIDDRSALLTDARKRAFEDARSKAQQYAELSGQALGKVVSIDENRSGNTPQPMQADAKAAVPMPLEPGTQTVRFDVTVKWSLG